MVDIEHLPEYDKQKKLCRDCGKEIKFIKSKFKETFMPVDAKPIKIVTSEGSVISGYTPHWDTSPECFVDKNNR